MAKSLLKRLPSPGRYEKNYSVHGFEHLVVEAEFSDGDFGRPQLMYWTVRDIRFTAGLDKWTRWLVFLCPGLSDVRNWITDGGPSLWDPQKRQADKGWWPVPEGWVKGSGGWTREEEGSEVPCGVDSGIGDQQRMVGRPLGSGPLRPEDGGPDRQRDTEDCRESDEKIGSAGLKRKRFAVAPGYIKSVSDGQLHWIGFGALTWLYGVDPRECVLVDEEKEDGWDARGYEHLIWLYPQRNHENYESMKQGLARGEDAFKLNEP